jgi:peptidoglycan/xylan/chitin deacetylase (PgdA/CDA1 family)
VRATFFLIGKPASENPEWVRRIAAAGHTVGHHTWSHNNLKYMSPEDAAGEIDKGIAAVEMALNGVSTTIPSTPFFRYPFFEMTKATLDDLEKRGIVVFGADLSANDWVKMTSEEQLKRMIESVDKTRKGIFLLHDAEAQTAAALPAFLRYLRDNRYRVVHVVPAGVARPVANVRQSEKRE